MVRVRILSGAVIPLAVALLAIAAWAVAAGVAPSAIKWMVLTLVMSLPALTLGQIITRRFPRHGVGSLLSGAGLIILGIGVNDTYLAAAQQNPGLPVSAVLVSITQGSWMLLYLPWALMLLVFPSGRFERPSERNLAIGLIVVVVAFGILVGLGAGPYVNDFQESHRLRAPVPGADLAAVLLLPAFLALLILSASRLLKRFRSSDPETRNQIRWLAVAGVSVPGTLLLCWAGYLINGNASVVVYGLVAMNLLLPAAIGLAILRSDLFDAGRVLVSLFGLLAVFGLVIALTALLMHWPGVADQSAATLTVAGVAAGTVGLVSLHPRIRRVAGLVLYAEHERLMDALSFFEGQVLEGAARPTDLEAVLRNATADSHLQVGYLEPGGSTYCDAHGKRLDTHGGIPVVLAGRPIGLILPSDTRERAINADATRKLAPMLETGRQQLELAAALAEVEASRTRLLLAAHHERQRLERDLHDGAQQRLVALGMGLRRIQRQLPVGTQALHSALDESVAELGTAVAELRQLAHGIRPSALDEGLPAALRQLSGRSPTPLSLTISEPLPAVPEMVAATAYFVASEAVHNAVKHSNAQRITVTLDGHGRGLRLCVSDNGCGGARQTTGGGLTGLEDRVKALGGRLDIASTAGRGTTVEALLPCA